MHGNCFRTKPGIVIVPLDNISVEELLIQLCKEWEAVVLKLL